jgi:hypothetical protein
MSIDFCKVSEKAKKSLVTQTFLRREVGRDYISITQIKLRSDIHKACPELIWQLFKLFS